MLREQSPSLLLSADRPTQGRFAVFSPLLLVLVSLATSFPGAAQSPPVVSFDRASYEVKEDEGQADFCMRRSGDLSQRTDVGMRTIPGTATDHPFTGGRDFFPLAGAPIVFLPGEAEVCAFIRLVDDDLVEDDESFQITFDVVQNGIRGLPNIVTVTIADDDTGTGTPRVSFVVDGVPLNSNGEYVLVSGDDRDVELTVRLDRPPLETVEVRVTGLGGDDQTLRFAGVREQTVTVKAPVSSTVPGLITILSPGDLCRRHPTLTNPSNADLGSPASLRVLYFAVPRREGSVIAIGETIGRLCDLIPNEIGCPFKCWNKLVDFWVPSSDQQAPPCTNDVREASLRTFARSSGLVSEDSDDTLRSLRDDLMAATPQGRYYTRLFESLTNPLALGLISRPTFIYQILEAHDLWLPGLRQLVAGNGETITLTRSMLEGLQGVLDVFKEEGDPTLRSIIELEEARLDLDSFEGLSFDQGLERVEQLGGPLLCVEDDTHLCLNEGRFQVSVEWRDFQGNTGLGHALPQRSDTGSFWFFGPDNVELMIKVLDARALNDHFWVFYGALSNVEYTITVLDTESGTVASYYNPLGEFGSVGDTEAISPDGGTAGAGSLRQRLQPTQLLRQAASATWARASTGLRRGWQRWVGRSAFDQKPTVERLRRLGVSSLQRLPDGGGNCLPGPTHLCLNQNRFRVEVEWSDFTQRRGVGQAVPLSPDTGSFWFFGPENLELVVKVLDGRSLNERFWVFYGALSNVEYTLTVTDTVTGAIKRYQNPLGEFGSVGDTAAF